MCCYQLQQLGNYADKLKQQEKDNIIKMVQLEIITPIEAREILQVSKLISDIIPICPDCKQEITKIYIKAYDGEKLFRGWKCGCVRWSSSLDKIDDN